MKNSKELDNEILAWTIPQKNQNKIQDKNFEMAKKKKRSERCTGALICSAQ